jgi:hypothetical protein
MSDVVVVGERVEVLAVPFAQELVEGLLPGFTVEFRCPGEDSVEIEQEGGDLVRQSDHV